MKFENKIESYKEIKTSAKSMRTFDKTGEGIRKIREIFNSMVKILQESGEEYTLLDIDC